MNEAKRTMDCTEAELRISERVDGEAVSVQEDARLDEHLAVCATCVEVLGRERQRSVALADALAAAPRSSERLVDSVLAQAAADVAGGEARIVRRPFRVLTSVVGLAAAALFAVFLGGRFDEPTDPGGVVDLPKPVPAPTMLVGSGGTASHGRVTAGPFELEVRRSVAHPDMIPAADGRPLRRETSHSKRVRSFFAPSTTGGTAVRFELQIEGTMDSYDDAYWLYR
jgi:hypothetical protein